MRAAAHPELHHLHHGDDARRRAAHGARAARGAAAVALFVAGFTIIFLALGASATLVGRVLVTYRVWVSRIGGLLVLVFGLYLLGVLKVGVLSRERRIHFSDKPLGYLGTVVVGVAFGAGWTPCVGPILGAILMYAGSSADVSRGVVPTARLLPRPRRSVRHHRRRDRVVPRRLRRNSASPDLGRANLGRRAGDRRVSSCSPIHSPPSPRAPSLDAVGVAEAAVTRSLTPTREPARASSSRTRHGLSSTSTQPASTASLPRIVIVAPRERHYCLAPRPSSHATTRQPIAVGQREVEQHQRRRIMRDDVVRLGDRRGGRNAIVGALEQHAHRAGRRARCPRR